MNTELVVIISTGAAIAGTISGFIINYVLVTKREEKLRWLRLEGLTDPILVELKHNLDIIKSYGILPSPCSPVEVQKRVSSDACRTLFASTDLFRFIPAELLGGLSRFVSSVSLFNDQLSQWQANPYAGTYPDIFDSHSGGQVDQRTASMANCLWGALNASLTQVFDEGIIVLEEGAKLVAVVKKHVKKPWYEPLLSGIDRLIISAKKHVQENFGLQPRHPRRRRKPD
jgi:hypothetical protein